MRNNLLVLSVFTTFPYLSMSEKYKETLPPLLKLFRCPIFFDYASTLV